MNRVDTDNAALCLPPISSVNALSMAQPHMRPSPITCNAWKWNYLILASYVHQFAVAMRACVLTGAKQPPPLPPSLYMFVDVIMQICPSIVSQGRRNLFQSHGCGCCVCTRHIAHSNGISKASHTKSAYMPISKLRGKLAHTDHTNAYVRINEKKKKKHLAKSETIHKWMQKTARLRAGQMKWNASCNVRIISFQMHSVRASSQSIAWYS